MPAQVVDVSVISQLPVIPEEPGVGFETGVYGRVQPASATTAVNIASDLSFMRKPSSEPELLWRYDTPRLDAGRRLTTAANLSTHPALYCSVNVP